MRLSPEGDQKFLEYSKSSTEASCIASVLWKEQESSLLSPDCTAPHWMMWLTSPNDPGK